MISPFSVKAESSQCEATKNLLINAYGITVAPEENSFKLSMKIDSQYLSSIPGLRQNKTTFKITRILVTKLGEKSIKYSEYVENPDKLAQDLIADYATEADLQSAFGLSGKILADGGSISFVNYQTGDVQYYVVLESTGNDVILKKNCDVDASSTVVLSFESYARIIPDDPEIPVVDPPTRKSGKILCPGNYAVGSFEYNYCRDLTLAEQHSDTRRFTFGKDEKYYQKYGLDKAEVFSCNAWAALEYIKANGVPQSDADYYTEVNRKYMIGVSSYNDKLDGLRYEYNTGGQNSSGRGNRVIYEDIYCKRTCTEIVTVEYGLPVASKAGMCFEYKVKVTSRVNCDAEVQNKPKPPRTCEPYPFCRSLTSSWTNDDAGPSLEFDSCIASCDGGKYTSNCSRKCYNEVYGVNTPLEKSRIPDFSEVVEKLNVPRNPGCDFQGKYFAHGSYVYWSPASCLARYYSHSGRANACVKTEGGGGFSAECDCQMVCQWQGCSDSYYLNPGEKEKDAQKNQLIYERALEECEKEVECMTTTAEFTISVDYSYKEKGEVVTKTIHFPYSENSSGSFDSIHYANGNFVCTKDQVNSTIISSMGCYACGDISDQGEYQTEWGFPGTWINKKTGVLSYKPITGPQEENWTKRKKFCLPFDAENVNQKWWNSYFEIVNVPGQYSYEDDGYVNHIEGCGTLAECQKVTNFTQQDTVKENIHARTRKFGYFGWNIDINCFYALNDSFPNYESYVCDSSTCDGPYVIRSVDLDKMFPSATDTSDNRSPGFNWSSYAKIPNETNLNGNDYSTVDFSADPYKYALWIQQNKYTIYSDDYLDYYVKLDKQTLKNLKSSTRDYTKFDGKVEVDSNNVVLNYQSPLFRGGEALANSVYPSVSTLRCNNIGVHNKGANYEAACFVVQDTDLKESGTNE